MGLLRFRWVSLALFAGLFAVLAGCSSSSNTGVNPTPTITSLSPSDVTAGSQGFTLFVTGTGFTSSSSGASFAYWNNSPRSTTLNTATSQLEVSIPASDVTAPGLVQVTIASPPPGGGVASAMFFTIETPQSGDPTISSFSPTSIAFGGGAFTLTVNGANFTANDVVAWNGSWRTTTFVNSSQLTAQITNTDIAAVVTAGVSVINSANAVVASPIVDFAITGPNNLVPAISSLSPTSGAAGTTGIEVAVSGSNFVRGSVVQWNGTPLATSFIGGSQLIALIPPSDLTTAGTANISVLNSAPGGGVSGNSTFMITAAAAALLWGAGHILLPAFLQVPEFARFFAAR